MLDIIAVLRDVDDYEENRNYWKYLKAKLRREGNQPGSVTTRFKFTAPDGKKHAANALAHDGVIELAKNFPAKQANRFLEWFTYSNETLDGKSRTKAYALFDSSLLDTIEVGTTKGLQRMHGYLFGGSYDFAGQIRSVDISEEFLDGALNIDLKVKIIYGGNSGGIIDQYISFTRILNRQIAEKGRTDEAVKEAIRICIDGDILREYLKLHEKEVISIMNTLFNQEYIARAWAAEERQIGRQEGRQEGRLEGRLEGERYMLFKLVKAGLVSLKDAAPKANLSEAAFAAQMDSYFTTVQ